MYGQMPIMGQGMMVNPYAQGYQPNYPQNQMYRQAMFGDLANDYPQQIQNEFQTQMLNYLRNPGPSKEYTQGVINAQNDAIQNQTTAGGLTLQDKAAAMGFGRSGAVQAGMRQLNENAALAKAGARRNAMMDSERIRLDNQGKALSLSARYGGLGGGGGGRSSGGADANYWRGAASGPRVIGGGRLQEIQGHQAIRSNELDNQMKEWRNRNAQPKFNGTGPMRSFGN